jgi:hypothetical protein
MAITFRPRGANVPATDLTVLVVALGVASAVELATLRLLTRTAVHIPALEHLQTPYGWLSDGGRYAYFVAIALLLPVLALLAMHLGNGSRLALAGVTLFVPAALGASLDLLPRAVLDVATIIAIGLLAAGIACQLPRLRAAIPVAAFGAATGLSGLYVAMPSFAELGLPARQPALMLTGSEYLALAFALTSPLLLTRNMDRAAQWAGVSVAVLALVLFLGNGSTMRFLLLWNAGMSGILPAVVYAAAAGMLALTVTALARNGSALAAAGVLLLVTGGIGLQSTYQSGLAVAGLAAIAIALSHGHRPRAAEI